MSRQKKKSKLLAYGKNIYKGVHREWNGNYEYNVEFENGDKCVTNKKNADASWMIGGEYNYEYEIKTFDWGQKHMAYSMKTDEELQKAQEYAANKASGGKTPRPSKMSPEKQKQIMAMVAFGCANRTFGLLRIEYKELSLAYLSWLILKGKDHDPITVQGVLKIACEFFDYNAEPDERETTLTEVLEFADETLINVEKAGKWSGQISQPSSETSQERSESPTQYNQEREENYDQRPPDEDEQTFLTLT